jgi:purine-binding chemotaxis protein CheW
VKGELFAVDVTHVQKVAWNLAVAPVPAAPAAVVGLSNIKGRVITILDLAALLGRGGNREAAPSVNAVIFKPPTPGGDQMGLRIDTPGDLVELDEFRPLSSEESKKGPISGIVEADHALYRVIDASSIIRWFSESGADYAEL